MGNDRSRRRTRAGRGDRDVDRERCDLVRDLARDQTKDRPKQPPGMTIIPSDPSLNSDQWRGIEGLHRNIG
jgi:hypothetical protein